MESKGEVNISPFHTKEQYLDLNLNLNSEEMDWEFAVEILRDRIYGRYLDQIETLSSDVNKNGFTIMALNCLLIETLLQFRDGKDETTNNKAEYSGFLKMEFPEVFVTRDIAKNFYTNIRCGILHSAQTKNNSRLSDRDDFVVRVENGILEVSVLGFTYVLRKYFNEYLKKLLVPEQTELRENFIKKMNFICRR